MARARGEDIKARPPEAGRRADLGARSLNWIGPVRRMQHVEEALLVRDILQRRIVRDDVPLQPSRERFPQFWLGVDADKVRAGRDEDDAAEPPFRRCDTGHLGGRVVRAPRTSLVTCPFR